MMNKDSFSFVIFIIHACAERWKKLSPEVYALLQQADCINDYLVPYYDVLHTQGEKYLVDDVEGYLTKRGVKI
jgi:hypothetical protein